MTRALIVEDDPRIRDTVVDVVESLGHEHDTASCQEAARKLLNGHAYSYALFDLEIPVKDGRNFPRIENGINLLREAIGQFGKRTPVIVMTAHGNDGPHQGVDCIKMGAADYIPKPFPIRGRTLDKAILEALDRSGQSGPRATVTQKTAGPPESVRWRQNGIVQSPGRDLWRRYPDQPADAPDPDAAVRETPERTIRRLCRF